MSVTPRRNILLNDHDLNRHRIIQEFLLIWLDINLDSSKGHNAFSRSIADLSDAFSSIYTFMDIDECIDFLTDVKYEKVFMTTLRVTLCPFSIKSLNLVRYSFCPMVNQNTGWLKSFESKNERMCIF